MQEGNMVCEELFGMLMIIAKRMQQLAESIDNASILFFFPRLLV